MLTRYPARKDGEAYVLREDEEETPRKKKKKVALANRAYQVPEITPRWIMDKISGDD